MPRISSFVSHSSAGWWLRAHAIAFPSRSGVTTTPQTAVVIHSSKILRLCAAPQYLSSVLDLLELSKVTDLLSLCISPFLMSYMYRTLLRTVRLAATILSSHAQPISFPSWSSTTTSSPTLPSFNKVACRRFWTFPKTLSTSRCGWRAFVQSSSKIWNVSHLNCRRIILLFSQNFWKWMHGIQVKIVLVSIALNMVHNVSTRGYKLMINLAMICKRRAKL